MKNTAIIQCYILQSTGILLLKKFYCLLLLTESQKKICNVTPGSMYWSNIEQNLKIMSFSPNEDSGITPKSDKINTNIKIICKCIHKHNKVSMTIKSYMVQTCYIHVENLNAYTILNKKKKKSRLIQWFIWINMT